MAAQATTSVSPKSRGGARTDGAAPLAAPVAVRVIDLEAPLGDLNLRRGDSGEPYRSLLAVARLEGEPLVVATFSVDAGGRVSFDRLATGLRRRLEAELREADSRPALTAVQPFPVAGAPRGIDRLRPVPTAPRSVSVVVATCNNPDALERCLRSILRSDYGDFEVIVVENRPGASDTPRMLATQFPTESRLRYVEEPRRGASRARNAGLAQAEGEIVAFTDDDVVVDRGWIRANVDALLSGDDVACVTGLILPLELESESQLLMEQFASFGKGFERVTYRLPESRRNNPLFPYTAGAIGSGASTVMRAEVARELGGFDTVLGPGTPATGGEDLEIFIRVLQAGHAVSYEPSAIVWHRHPDGMPRLRRQVYKYGVGLGAMLAKQLIAGPTRRDFLRAVPAGVRYARDPTSRKNAGKPSDYPRHLTWFERLGMLIGPAAYVLSAVLAMVRRMTGAAGSRKTRPTGTVRRIALSGGQTVSVVWFEERDAPALRLQRYRPSAEHAISRSAQAAALGVATVCLAAPLVVALGLPTAVRMPAVLALLCLAPGMAFLTAVRGRLEPGLVVGISLGVTAVTAQSMLWLGAWAPRSGLYALAGACFLPLSLSLKAAMLRRPTVAGIRSAVRRVARAFPRTPAAHAGVLSVALLAWAVSLQETDLSRMAGIGLLDALPPTYFLAFALTLVGFAVAATSDELDARVLGAYVLALIVILHGTTAFLYDEPRYSWVYKHLGVINLIAAHGRFDRQIDIYNNWPAFFAANAWLVKTTGLAPIAYAGFAQLFFNILNAIAVRFALRGVTRNERVLWTATFLFVLGNWVGQDYLAPQAFGFALSLIVIGLCLRCGPATVKRRSRLGHWLASQLERLLNAVLGPRGTEDELAAPPLGPRAALLVGGVCFMAVVTSHQLSPVLLILSIAAIAAFAQRVPIWVPAAMAAVEVWWVALAWPFVGTHFNLVQPGSGGAAAAGRNLGAALPGASLSFYAPAAVMMVMVVIAAIGLLRRLRVGQRDLVPVCLIGAPVVGIGLQSYGGEGPYRGYLFALPWLAFLAAHACTQRPSPGWRARISFRPLIVATSALGACLLFAYFGQELSNQVPSDDVRASTWYEQHAAPGSIRFNLAPTAPDRLTARYPLVSLGDPSSLLEQPGFTGHRLGAADVPRLTDLIRHQGTHPTYVVLTLGQENYARLNGLLPKGSVTGLAQALRQSAAFSLVYERPTAWVFRYVPDPVSAASNRPAQPGR